MNANYYYKEQMINLFKVFMAENASAAVAEVLKSGFVGQGPKVEKFEENLRNYFGNPYINTLNSATSGLQLALHLCKISYNLQPDDEVLTTPLTCTATNTAIVANNLKLKWVDIDVATGNISLHDLASKISPKTKIIMLVHWGGYPCDLDEIKIILDKSENLYGFRPIIVEDCAHAWGATYKNILIGNHGNICVFSLQAIKHVNTGDGGVIICPDDNMHKQAKLLRWYGLDRTTSNDFRCEQNIKLAGFKYHMNDIAAAIGICNLAQINFILKGHVGNGSYYNKNLQNVHGINLLENKDDRQSSYWIYTLKVEARSDFMRKMKEKKIAVSQVHDRNDKHECFREFQSILPSLDIFSKEMICIPSGWWLSEEDREFIVDSIKEGW